MITLGLTGGIGSGKTTVTSIFKLLNIPIYIADVASKRLVATSPIIKNELIKLYGEDLFGKNGLNKQMLAQIIFSDKEELDRVNKIIHPLVEKDFYEWRALQKQKKHKFVIHEAAILFESGFNKIVDKTILVYSPLELRIERCMKRDNISREEVLKRINNQWSDEKKLELCDFVIYNEDSQSLIKQVCHLIKNLVENKENEKN